MRLVASSYRNGDKLRPDGPQLARMQTLPLLVITVVITAVFKGAVSLVRLIFRFCLNSTFLSHSLVCC